jgi:hypothetical protein
VKLYDHLESYWESSSCRKAIMFILTITFVVALIAVEMRRSGWLEAAWIPDSPFYAIHLALSLLLIIEVIGLVFVLTHSVANAVGKQFEILSLILLRHTFTYFSESLTWEHLSDLALHVLSDAGAALVVFILLGLYYRVQRHEPITREEQGQRRFIMAKKMLALAMLVVLSPSGS